MPVVYMLLCCKQHIYNCMPALAPSVPFKLLGHLQKSILYCTVPQPEVSTRVVLPMASASDLEAWEKLDDNIMGGSSSSGLMAMPQEAGVQGAMWQGELIIEVSLRVNTLDGASEL